MCSVLSLQGDILQVVTHPRTEPSAESGLTSICCFGDKMLLARCYCYTECGSVPELITSSEFAASPIDGATLPLDTVLAWQGLGRGDSSWL